MNLHGNLNGVSGASPLGPAESPRHGASFVATSNGNLPSDDHRVSAQTGSQVSFLSGASDPMQFGIVREASPDGPASSSAPDNNEAVPEGHLSLRAPAEDTGIQCCWDDCSGTFRLSEFSDHWRTHAHVDDENRCLWQGCFSTAKHAKQHVYDSHLGLRYTCSRCYRADFTALRSLQRHKAPGGGCPMSQPAPGPLRCAHCALVWQNQAEMNEHAPFCVRAGSLDRTSRV